MELLTAYLDTCVVSGLAKEDLAQPDLEALLKVLQKHKNEALSLVTSRVTKEEIDHIPKEYRLKHEVIDNLLSGLPGARAFRTDILACFWPVRREALPKGIAALWRDDFCRTYGPLDGILPRLFVGMMPIWCAAALSNRAFARGKDVLPAPLAACLGVFSFKRKRQRDRAEAFHQAFGALPSRYLA